MLDLIVNSGREMTDCEGCSILLLDAKGRELEKYKVPYLVVTGAAGDPAARKLEGFVKGLLDNVTRHLGKELSLSATIALEHFTALLADSVLREPKVIEGAEPHYKALWQWHALEETEHKAVAFDVYKAVGGSEFVRVTEMMLVSVLFPLFTTIHVVQLMKEAGELGNVRSWARGFNYMWGRPGVFRKLLPAYFKFYAPSFHPWNHDARDLVEKAKKKWLGDWA